MMSFLFDDCRFLSRTCRVAGIVGFLQEDGNTCLPRTAATGRKRENVVNKRQTIIPSLRAVEMKKAKRSYTEMTTEELRAATARYDKPFAAVNESRSLRARDWIIHERAKKSAQKSGKAPARPRDEY
ncbi:MAG TPA: hypothetical protein VFE47_17385 [Tepidisphaeraceae bacterium]|jgi:hypothetical protein|nr:hypothetical protein [Tepidisphaeraceae bacterium]